MDGSRLFRDPYRLLRVLRRVLLILIGIGILYIIFRYDYPRLQQNNNALSPVIGPGEKVIFDRWYYAFHPVKRKDLVGYRADWGGEKDVIFFSRVLGIPGDRLESKDGRLAVNGVPTVYEDPGSLESPVPEGMFLLLNDNEKSLVPDGRFFGLIREEKIAGKLLTYLPF